MLFGLLYVGQAGVMVVGGCTGVVPLLLRRENLTTWNWSTFTFQSMAMGDSKTKLKISTLAADQITKQASTKKSAYWLSENCGILTQLDWTQRMEEQFPHISSCSYVSTCGSTGNFSVLSSLLQELGDQMELERISKLEYLMRTKEHWPNLDQSGSNPKAEGVVG